MSRLRLIPFHELGPAAQLVAIADRVAQSPPGLVLVTGQGGSGKFTMALALAQRLARPGQPVLLLHPAQSALSEFGPLPPAWRRVVVAAEDLSVVQPAQAQRWR